MAKNKHITRIPAILPKGERKPCATRHSQENVQPAVKQIDIRRAITTRFRRPTARDNAAVERNDLIQWVQHRAKPTAPKQRLKNRHPLANDEKKGAEAIGDFARFGVEQGDLVPRPVKVNFGEQFGAYSGKPSAFFQPSGLYKTGGVSLAQWAGVVVDNDLIFKRLHKKVGLVPIGNKPTEF